MDNLIADQLEWLFSCNLQGNRFARHLLVIAGFLADGAPPEHINRQLAALSRQVMLLETFDALVASLNLFSKAPARAKAESATAEAAGNPELVALIEQIHDARQQLIQCESVNYAEIVGWITAQAKERKLLGKARRR